MADQDAMAHVRHFSMTASGSSRWKSSDTSWPRHPRELGDDVRAAWLPRFGLFSGVALLLGLAALNPDA